jgi:hypothetical protein
MYVGDMTSDGSSAPDPSASGHQFHHISVGGRLVGDPQQVLSDAGLGFLTTV